MTWQNWQWSPHPSPPSGHSNELEGRVVRLEVHQERQEDINEQHSDRMKWLERGLQSLAVIVLLVIAKQAPSSAAGLAELLLAIIKR